MLSVLPLHKPRHSCGGWGVTRYRESERKKDITTVKGLQTMDREDQDRSTPVTRPAKTTQTARRALYGSRCLLPGAVVCARNAKETR